MLKNKSEVYKFCAAEAELFLLLTHETNTTLVVIYHSAQPDNLKEATKLPINPNL